MPGTVCARRRAAVRTVVSAISSLERRAGAKSTTCHFRNTSLRSAPTFVRQCIRQVHVSQLAHNRLPERRVHSAQPRLSFLGARCGLTHNICEAGATFAVVKSY